MMALENSVGARGWTVTSVVDMQCGSSTHLRLALRSDWVGSRAHVNQLSVRTRITGTGRSLRRVVVRAGFQEILHNQVLLSAVAASTLGQLVKPFAAALSGKGFNWKLIIKSGGLPSSHSAAVTAAATALAFERGLSDGVFGLSVVIAGVVMYDAQGVRNAVGKHAKVINTMVVSYAPNLPQSEVSVRAVPSATLPSPAAIGSELARSPVEAELAFLENTTTSSSSSSSRSLTATLETTSPGADNNNKNFNPQNSSNGAVSGMIDRSYVRTKRFFDVAGQLPTMKVGEVDIQELGNQDGWQLLPLKESIGHTKVEVVVGGIWGILICYALHSITNP